MTAFLILTNLIAFALMGIDKQKAIRKERRIPEITLILASACMGAAGGLLGMLVFRHKTRHLKFVLLLPVLLIAQSALVIYIL